MDNHKLDAGAALRVPKAFRRGQITHLARTVRRAVRKATKPLHLRLITWKHYRCEVEVMRLHEMRHDLVQLEVAQRRRQVELSIRHNQVSRW